MNKSGVCPGSKVPSLTYFVHLICGNNSLAIKRQPLPRPRDAKYEPLDFRMLKMHCYHKTGTAFHLEELRPLLLNIPGDQACFKSRRSLIQGAQVLHLRSQFAKEITPPLHARENVMHPAWHLGHSTGAAVFTLIQLYNGALCSRFFSPGCNQLYQEHSSMRQMSSTHI